MTSSRRNVRLQIHQSVAGSGLLEYSKRRAAPLIHGMVASIWFRIVSSCCLVDTVVQTKIYKTVILLSSSLKLYPSD